MQSAHKSTAAVHSIDDQLLRLRQAQSRGEYRARILTGVPHVGSVGSLRVLRAIERAEAEGRSPSIREVAAEVGIEQSTASRAVNETDRRGLTVRQACESDQRRVLLTLTDEGRAAADRATQNRRDIVAEALAGWSPDDVKTLDTLFSRFVGALSEVDAGDTEDAG